MSTSTPRARRARRRTALVAGGAVAVALAAGGPGGVAAAFSPGVPPLVPGVCLYTPEIAGSGDARYVGLPDPFPPAGATVATLSTNVGDITLTLDPAAAPCTVNSFRFLVEQGFFDDTECHRMLAVEKAGVLQCGDPTATGRGGPGYAFGDENLSGATYGRGVLAMANSGPNTNGSQFFMVFRPSSFRPDYTPFGTIDAAGLKILDKVAKKGTYGPDNDRPHTRVVISKVTLR